MYFPSDMNFQYFFFETYIGFFLQVLPIAIIAAVVWFFLRFRNDRETPLFQKIIISTFVCYLMGLACLVSLLDVVRIIWYTLLYHRPSGIIVNWLGGEFNFIPDFWHHINGESVGNFLMFLPFGIIYPLAHPKDTLKKLFFSGRYAFA